MGTRGLWLGVINHLALGVSRIGQIAAPNLPKTGGSTQGTQKRGVSPGNRSGDHDWTKWILSEAGLRGTGKPKYGQGTREAEGREMVEGSKSKCGCVNKRKRPLISGTSSSASVDIRIIELITRDES